MNQNKGITRVLIDCDSGNIIQEDQEDIFTNACVSFLLLCKHNFQGKLLLYRWGHKKSKPIIAVDLEKDVTYFTMISQSISDLEEENFYGKFDLAPDLYVIIDWHANYFLIERKKRERGCFEKMRLLISACRTR